MPCSAFTCAQVGYAVFGKKVPYSDDIFMQLARDFFHLMAPPDGIDKAADLPRLDTAGWPVWWDKLKPDADPGKFHKDAVASIARCVVCGGGVNTLSVTAALDAAALGSVSLYGQLRGEECQQQAMHAWLFSADGTQSSE